MKPKRGRYSRSLLRGSLHPSIRVLCKFGGRPLLANGRARARVRIAVAWPKQAKIQRRLEPNAVSDLNLRRPYFLRPFIHVGDHVVVLTGR